MSSACPEHPLSMPSQRAIGRPLPKSRRWHSVLRGLGLGLSLLALAAQARELRVCADPNNLPFSNQRGEGFENRIAELIARDLHAELRYTWWAQRRGFIRNTLNAGKCDLITGLPQGMEKVLLTRPYYRSSFVFVTRTSGPRVRSLDDPVLRERRLGVQLVGEDGENPPPAHALARRGIIGNVRGYSVYGDYRKPNPPAGIIRAVAAGDIDIGLAWGPLAGYFAKRQAVQLRITPISPPQDGGLPMTFAIAMGVRRDDEPLRREIDAVLQRRKSAIDAILDSYDVPRIEPALASQEPP